MPANSKAIANEFIERSIRDGRPLTQMQLQKLVYIAHGWMLALFDRPLTLDSPEAWRYGPVYRDLREALKKYGTDRIPELIGGYGYIEDEIHGVDYVYSVPKGILHENESTLIDEIYKDYAKFEAFQLSALTHKEGTPWTKVYDSGKGENYIIPNSMIKEHFLKLANKK